MLYNLGLWGCLGLASSRVWEKGLEALIGNGTLPARLQHLRARWIFFIDSTTVHIFSYVKRPLHERRPHGMALDLQAYARREGRISINKGGHGIRTQKKMGLHCPSLQLTTVTADICLVAWSPVRGIPLVTAKISCLYLRIYRHLETKANPLTEGRSPRVKLIESTQICEVEAAGGQQQYMDIYVP